MTHMTPRTDIPFYPPARVRVRVVNPPCRHMRHGESWRVAGFFLAGRFADESNATIARDRLGLLTCNQLLTFSKMSQNVPFCRSCAEISFERTMSG
jgi:hypothetical protein